MKLLAIIVLLLIGNSANGASLKLPSLITKGHSDSARIDQFGKYNMAYYQRRWKRMCAGSARYDAMREAYEMKKEQPCK